MTRKFDSEEDTQSFKNGKFLRRHVQTSDFVERSSVLLKKVSAKPVLGHYHF